jgi:hypothetical protein
MKTYNLTEAELECLNEDMNGEEEMEDRTLQEIIELIDLKPVLSSELNHVEKAIQTRAGIVITATDKMKKAGGFDGSVGSYEKYIQYLKPLNNLLTTPMMIIGLEPPETFKIKQDKIDNKTIGKITKIQKENN